MKKNIEKEGVFQQGDIMIWNFSCSNMTHATAKLLNLLHSKAKLERPRSGTSGLSHRRGRSLPRQRSRPQQPRWTHPSESPSCSLRHNSILVLSAPQHQGFAIKEWEQPAFIHLYTFTYKGCVFIHTHPSSSCKLGNLSWIILWVSILTLSGNGDDLGINSTYSILPKMKYESCAYWKYSACLSI